MELINAISIGTLFGIGLFQILRRNAFRSILGLIILANAVNLFLLTMGAYSGEVAAYVDAAGQTSDPLPQALTLTAIVIGMGSFTLLLGILLLLVIRHGRGDMDKFKDLQY
ncbi:hypothetical protein BVX98_06950 [bacterium F11]|nr:hypothetical protein BVX98_06950 [bacterium F11]